MPPASADPPDTTPEESDLIRPVHGDVVFVTDRDGTIVDVNEAFVEITGYSRAEAIGSTPRLLRSGVQRDEVYADLWQTIKAGDVWEGELVDRRRDGALRTHRVTISPVIDGSGHITHFVAVERDLTGELDREGPTSGLGLIHTDATGRCIYADARAGKLLGRTRSSALGDGFVAALADDDAYELRDVIGMAMETGRDHRLDVRTADDRWLHLTVGPLRVASGAIIGARLGLEDVTSQVSAERRAARHEALVVGVLNAFDEPIAVVATDGSVVVTNRAWEQRTSSGSSGDPVLSVTAGDDLLERTRAAAADGDQRASALQRDLDAVLTGRAAVGSSSTGVRVTAVPWDEGGAVVRVMGEPAGPSDQGRSVRQSPSRRSSLAPTTSSAS